MTSFGIKGISTSSVFRITKELDGKVSEFLSKPIEHEIPYRMRVFQQKHYQ
ncbi:Mobile element protein [Methanosarcina siciliae T4/M]|uniref:Mobile element protein n=2 Tax=Methanosarcina siciliae TaxID=38027 RepID=A0A0E3PER0_9EURY|nr:Mobile element protein [Methanosarcina siciliae T4/M]AKB32328.1 Mobile element protein [Methanosarcina siciliae HI350]